MDRIVAGMEAMTFRALGEPSRLRIVELLRAGPRSVGEIVEALGIRQPQASKHLRVLSESGLVTREHVATRRIYHLQSAPFEAMGDWVESFEALWDVRLDRLGDYLESITDERTTDERDEP